MAKSDMNGIELIVGTPSYMEADTIGFVVRQIDVGIQRYFGTLRAVIVNADNNSEDGTREAFLATDTVTPK